MFRITFCLLGLNFRLSGCNHGVPLGSSDFKSCIFVHLALNPLSEGRRAHSITTRQFSVIPGLHFRRSFLSNPVSGVLLLRLRDYFCRLLLLIGIFVHFTLDPIFKSARTHTIISRELSKIFDLGSRWVSPVFGITFGFLCLNLGLSSCDHGVPLGSSDFESCIFVHLALDPLSKGRRAHSVTTR
jgi:hypothetical protein